MKDEELTSYLELQDQNRLIRALNALRSLTPREALLVREAAVIGYVEGRQDERVFQGSPTPTDAEILRISVISALAANDSNHGHFPLLAAAERGRRPEVPREYSERGLQPDAPSS